jgi:hypothetical protein
MQQMLQQLSPMLKYTPVYQYNGRFEFFNIQFCYFCS